ncbi:nitrous oxide reductase family maturation protein NosD [Bacteroidota bacterium]
MKLFYPIIILSIIIVFSTCKKAVVSDDKPGDELSTILSTAKGGDTIMVEAGTYPAQQIQDLNFTADKPLVIKSFEKGGAIIKSVSNKSGTTLEIRDCSYIKFEGFVIEGGLWGLYVKSSDHIILTNNEIRDTGQEGIHIGYSSKYIDVIGNHVHDTGNTNPKWGEGIYVGSGSYGRNRKFPDNCEYVWVENNIVHDCGKGDGINIKGECFHITVIGNEVYNISPGTEVQYNQAAISIESAGNSVENNYRLDEPRDVWIINNTVHNVSGGYSNWDNGIMFTGTGSYVVGNTIYECDNHGIFGNDYSILPLPTYLYDNEVHSCGEANQYNEGLTIKEKDPGENPNRKQQWTN